MLPSRYEGFGLTCLEAMACGTPVVAADRAALPETCGDAALLVDPDDGAALTRAVRIAATDVAAREAMRAAGLRRAAQFSWDRTAETGGCPADGACGPSFDELMARLWAVGCGRAPAHPENVNCSWGGWSGWGWSPRDRVGGSLVCERHLLS